MYEVVQQKLFCSTKWQVQDTTGILILEWRYSCFIKITSQEYGIKILLTVATKRKIVQNRMKNILRGLTKTSILWNSFELEGAWKVHALQQGLRFARASLFQALAKAPSSVSFRIFVRLKWKHFLSMARYISGVNMIAVLAFLERIKSFMLSSEVLSSFLPS